VASSVPLADRADHGGLASRRHDRGAACLVEARDDVVDLLGCRMPAHHDQQLGCTGDSHPSEV